MGSGLVQGSKTCSYAMGCAIGISLSQEVAGKRNGNDANRNSVEVDAAAARLWLDVHKPHLLE